MSIERSKIRWNGWGWVAHDDALAGREELWSWLASELGMPSLLATPARPLEDIPLGASRLSPAERQCFASILGADRIHDDAHERAFHARGKSYHDLLHLRSGDLSVAPDAVLYPRGTEEVLRVLAFASENAIAVVPFGGGTSVVGGVNASTGGFRAVVSLDLTGMERISEIDTVAGTATAEAGIYGIVLEKALQAKSLRLGHYPQSFEFSTLGGWIAHRGAGQQSNRYGKPDDWLLSVRLATPCGLLSTEDFPSSAAGPRLTDLVIGSEGVFGIITEARVRALALPEDSKYRGFLFRDFAGGITAIRQAMREEIPTSMLRLSDAEETRFLRGYAAVGKRRGLAGRVAQGYLATRGIDERACVLIAGFEGSSGHVDVACRRFQSIAKRLGALSLGASQGKNWHKTRFQAPYLRDPMLDRGVGVDTLETAASWTRLPMLYAAVRSAIEDAIGETVPHPSAHGIVMCHISHSYPDGASLYFTYIFPRALDGELTQWQKIKNAASEAIIAHGGTISHHHGVGEDHLPWITAEKSALGIDVLRAIKRSLDPNGILNPGKLIPAEA
jgi:alkyldihydroxyacetonephosphate synthase